MATPSVKLMLCGQSGAGKSWLIRQLCSKSGPVCGFTTDFHRAENVQGIYMQRAFSAPRFTAENRVGLRGPCPGSALGVPQTFDTLGADLLRQCPAGSTVVMDELGYLERDAEVFLRQVEHILTGDYRVLAAIKLMPCPHLLRLRQLPGVTVLHLTRENRAQIARQAAALWNTDTL